MALDPKILATLDADIAALKTAKKAAVDALNVLKSAQDAHAGAVANLERLRGAVLKHAASLAGADLDDNFLVLSDAEAAQLAEKAKAAKSDLAKFIKAKLAG